MDIYQNPSTLFDVKNKVAVITGASGALGGMAAKILAGAGAKLLLAADDTKAIAGECRQLGAEVGEITTDISKPHTQSLSEKIIHSAVDQFGRVDILVVASGINDVDKIVDMEPERFQNVMDVNLMISWLMCKAAGAQMLKQGNGGKIVLISSARGSLGHPSGYTAYCASKFAVNGITRALGCEWGQDGINVNAIAPIVFRSTITDWMFEETEASREVNANFLKRIPKGRLGEVEDLAGPLLFLVSKASDFYTGQTLHADGGYTSG